MIVVIAILAGLTIIAYNSIQGRAFTSTVQHDLSNTAKLMAISHAETGVYPGVLPGEARTSPGVTLTLISTPGGYSGLSPVQNGVLFQSICQQLVNEGYGRDTNMGGGTDVYITGCHVYNHNAMQINGWNAHDFGTPLTASSIHSWYNTNVAPDSWRPNKKQTYLDFANKLSSDFTAAGGTFPVASFWDPWAASNNGGVTKDELPAPTSGASSETFCLQAAHERNASSIWHISAGSTPQLGACS